MIEARTMSKMYGENFAVREISFSVQRGEIVGFLGPNGAGKTTTMRMLTGALSPSSGTAIIAGHDIQEEPLEAKKRIGYLPEIPPLYEDLRVESYLDFVTKIKGVPSAERKDRIQWAISRCGLEEVRSRVIGNLSKGFKQRVGLAQAIINRPDVLILDEPTIGLDPRQIREIRELIQELSKDHTIILSTHILPEVTMICGRVILINRGKIILSDLVSSLTKEKSLEEVFMELISKDETEKE